MAALSDMAFSVFIRGVVIPVVGKIALRSGYYATVARDADDVMSDRKQDRLLVGRGVLRDHTGIDATRGVALCGVPVSSWTGGGLADVQCRLCRRALHAAGRRASMRHHPAGRARPLASSSTASSSAEPRGALR